MNVFFGRVQGVAGPCAPYASPATADHGLLSGFVRHLSVPSWLWIDFPGQGLSYAAGSDSTAIRRTILPKSRLVRWLSASKSQ